jgi:Zn-dependent peptidase ImmA (M78 family)/transcriptional regulator with XRE-family HTH domain
VVHVVDGGGDVNQRRMAVEPEVISWARRSAGLSIEQAAKQLGVRPGKVLEWEEGATEPTIVQLRKAAAAYNRPFAAMFMTRPPQHEEAINLPDFRRATTVARGDSPALRKAILRARRQQDALQDVLDEGGDPDVSKLDAVLLNRDADAETSAATLRKSLGIGSMLAGVSTHPEYLLRRLVTALEDRGYLVIQVQNVPMDEMRGFSLGEGVAPVVALNGADWPRGKVFTLLHEVVHIGLKHSGLCDLSRDTTSQEERFCDAVAAAALLPEKEFRKEAAGVNPLSLRALDRLAHQFGASAEAGLLRMVNLRLATWDEYWEMKPSFRDAYLTYKRSEKELNADKDVPLYYALKVRDLGRPFIRTVVRAHDDGTISARDVTNLLEVSYDKVARLAADAGVGA